MEKDKKYNIVLGIMIFLFILVVGAAVAWGLGIIGLKNDDVKENSNSNNVIEDNIDMNNNEDKKEQLISNIEEAVLKEYIEKIYKRFEMSMPEFKNINDADESWLWGVTYQNCQFGSIDMGNYVDDTVVYKDDMINKGKELFGDLLTKVPPVETNPYFIEYNSEHDCYINVGRGGTLANPEYVVSEISRENDIFTVIILEYVYDETAGAPGFGNEDKPFIISLNSGETKVVTFNSNEKFDVEKYVLENKDKFVQKKLTIKNNGGKYNLVSSEIIK